MKKQVPTRKRLFMKICIIWAEILAIEWKSRVQGIFTLLYSVWRLRVKFSLGEFKKDTPIKVKKLLSF